MLCLDEGETNVVVESKLCEWSLDPNQSINKLYNKVSNKSYVVTKYKKHKT